ncbi:histidine kinase [Winogradskyella sp. F6397]|uniref:Histidine kinase n=1 Tax=Winogradskyella marina TaxID=2785530 RepID=A0ABS0EGP6_9FLAO|nr:histidine kinase [Winogradskyella marina]MBF8149614.1 histidine kinase [Winogradskyella marina]
MFLDDEIKHIEDYISLEHLRFKTLVTRETTTTIESKLPKSQIFAH